MFQVESVTSKDTLVQIWIYNRSRLVLLSADMEGKLEEEKLKREMSTEQ